MQSTGTRHEGCPEKSFNYKGGTLVQNHDEVWTKVLDKIRRQIGTTAFNLWFSNTCLRSFCRDRCEIGVPNTFTGLWLQRNFLSIIQEKISSAVGRNVEVGFSVGEIELHEPKDKHGVNGASNGTVSFANSAESKNQPTCSAPQKIHRLEDFIVGPSNRFAYASALEIVKDTGPSRLSSLLVYGSVGLGKTHLLQGIWNFFKDQGDPLKAVYMPAEAWTNEFIHALKRGKLEDFRQKYRKVDVFLMDDVHFLSSKEGIQEELIHTINALVQSSKRIIFASDAHPRVIREFKESLVNRMMGGMLAEIHPPDFATTLNIINTKMGKLGHAYNEEVLQFMAAKLNGRSIREIESTLTTLLAYTMTYQKEVDVRLVDEVLNWLFGQRRRHVTLDDIETVIRGHFNLSTQELRSTTRKRSNLLPKQFFCYFARTLTNHSHEEISRRFGHKGHTFCIAATTKMKKRLEEDKVLLSLMDKLQEDINRRALLR